MSSYAFIAKTPLQSKVRPIDPFGGNVDYVTIQITFHIPELACKERNLHCTDYHQMGL